MARLGRSIRITLHLHRHMYSPFKIRGFTLNFSKFWVSTPKMKGWSRLSRPKFSFARRVKTLMETLIIFSSSSYLSQPPPQKSFCFYHFPPFPRPPQCKTEPNQSENLSHRSTLFAAAASSSCPSVQKISKNPVDSVFVVMPLRVLTPPAHWLKDNCGTAGPRLVDWLGKGLVVARIVVTWWRHFLVWSIKQFLWKSLSILIVPHSSTDKVCRIEKIKGKRDIYPCRSLGRLVTTHVCIGGAKGWSEYYSVLPHVLLLARRRRGEEKTRTQPAFCRWPQGREP